MKNTFGFQVPLQKFDLPDIQSSNVVSTKSRKEEYKVPDYKPGPQKAIHSAILPIEVKLAEIESKLFQSERNNSILFDQIRSFEKNFDNKFNNLFQGQLLDRSEKEKMEKIIRFLSDQVNL